MSALLKFNIKYLILAILLFVVEVLIAVYAHDDIIRPYIGDVLVVILLYCLIKGFLNTPIVSTAFVVLLFSFIVETLQYFHFVKLVGLEKSTIASIVIGTDFAWADLLSYVVGIVIVLSGEQIASNRTKISDSGI